MPVPRYKPMVKALSLSSFELRPEAKVYALRANQLFHTEHVFKTMNTEIVPRTTLTMLVAAWRESEAEIRQAFGLLVSAEKRLKETFKPDSYLFNLSRTDSRYRRY